MSDNDKCEGCENCNCGEGMVEVPRELLGRILAGALHEACGGPNKPDPDPTWHCCDWGEVVEEVQALLLEDEIVTFANEAGEERDYTVSGVFPCGERRYALLGSVDEDNDDALIMRVETNAQGNLDFVAVDGDEERDAALQALEMWLMDVEPDSEPEAGGTQH